jgi:addiction module RelE/StbE family toxin
VKRKVIATSYFVRTSKRVIQKNRGLERNLHAALELLSENAFDPRLKTHKLKGEWTGSWACSAGYDLRVVFQFIKQDGLDVISLQSIGTHDDVY